MIIIIVLLLLLIFITVRHFPALAILDVDNIPEEKEERIKEKIIKSRIRRKFFFWTKFFNRLAELFNKLLDSWRIKLNELQDRQRQRLEAKSLFGASLAEKNKWLFSQADDFIKQENWAEAEKKLIAVISLDDKNFSAFFKLGEVYRLEEKWQEAKQTLLYAAKLAEVYPAEIDRYELAKLNYSLALIGQGLNDLAGAIDNLLKSLEIDSNNPRYLDLMLDLCIMKKDKGLALRFLEKIKEVNPDNKNIPIWEEDIRPL